MTRLPILLVASIFGMGGAIPGSAADAYYTGAMLLADLDRGFKPSAEGEARRNDELVGIAAQGYVVGVADDTGAKDGLCIAKDTPVIQLVEAAASHLREHREQLADPAAPLVRAALRKRWPCAKR